MNRTEKQIVFSGAVICLLCMLLPGCSSNGKEQKPDPGIRKEADADMEKTQMNAMFAHIGLSMNDFEEANSRKNSGLAEWWYRGKEDPSNGIYIAIGDLQQNGGDHYAEFADTGMMLDGSEDYELEITAGTLDADGFLDGESEMQNYYFLQSGSDISFVCHTETQN